MVLLGSTARTATFFPKLVRYFPNASIKVLFPTPGIPVIPILMELFAKGKHAFTTSFAFDKCFGLVLSTNEIAQLQGVWVNPSMRGQGLAAPALAAAVVEIRASGAQAVSLYVNDFNIPARKTYDHVGFKQMATFATVLF